jgi:hypothetical protein
MYQQFEVILDGEKYMELASQTSTSHKIYCSTLGIFENYTEKVSAAGGVVGGNSKQESEDHLLARYLNSASRTQAVICIEDEKCETIKLEMLFQLSDGDLNIIDIAAGHGAGTLSLLNTICDMRNKGVLKMGALNITIHALDYSETSLTYYSEMVKILAEFYEQHGIFVSIISHLIDITSDLAVTETINLIKTTAGQDPRYLLICSAISGVSKKLFHEKFALSYETIAKGFKEKNSSFLWVEPRTKRKWMQKYWQDYFDKIDVDPDVIFTLDENIVQQEFAWIDPHNNVKMAESFADYLLIKLA